MNTGENVGIWLAILAASTALAAWNISRLRIVRPALDRLIALIGSAAIVMVVTGASLVVTEVTQCFVGATSLATCSTREIALVAVLDVAASVALITQWLRADACRASFAAVRVRGIPPTRRPRET